MKYVRKFFEIMILLLMVGAIGFSEERPVVALMCIMGFGLSILIYKDL